MTKPQYILGIESSCDDSAAAVIACSALKTDILSNVVHTQTHHHAKFGGIVPEIAARAHVEILDQCVQQALDQAHLNLSDIDAVCVTAGPGLIGGVVCGVMLAKGLAYGLDVPLIGVNHLAGHALTARLTDNVCYPYLMLLASGGHCQFVIVEGADTFTRIGGTIDDAPGEAFDKVARILGLAQPGGPEIEKCAKKGRPSISLPRPLLDRQGCNMSFSGLKTATLRARDACLDNGALTAEHQADLAASFQTAVVDILHHKTRQAIDVLHHKHPVNGGFAVAGGVAANQAVQAALKGACADAGVAFYAPPMDMCTDNAAMIAYAGAQLLHMGVRDDMTLSARPRWPLDSHTPALLGSGKKGAKA